MTEKQTVNGGEEIFKEENIATEALQKLRDLQDKCMLGSIHIQGTSFRKFIKPEDLSEELGLTDREAEDLLKGIGMRAFYSALVSDSVECPWPKRPWSVARSLSSQFAQVSFKIPGIEGRVVSNNRLFNPRLVMDTQTGLYTFGSTYYDYLKDRIKEHEEAVEELIEHYDEAVRYSLIKHLQKFYMILRQAASKKDKMQYIPDAPGRVDVFLKCQGVPPNIQHMISASLTDDAAHSRGVFTQYMAMYATIPSRLESVPLRRDFVFLEKMLKSIPDKDKIRESFKIKFSLYAIQIPQEFEEDKKAREKRLKETMGSTMGETADSHYQEHLGDMMEDMRASIIMSDVRNLTSSLDEVFNRVDALREKIEEALEGEENKYAEVGLRPVGRHVPGIIDELGILKKEWTDRKLGRTVEKLLVHFSDLFKAYQDEVLPLKNKRNHLRKKSGKEEDSKKARKIRIEMEKCVRKLNRAVGEHLKDMSSALRDFNVALQLDLNSINSKADRMNPKVDSLPKGLFSLENVDDYLDEVVSEDAKFKDVFKESKKSGTV